jgi:hypothetical protein
MLELDLGILALGADADHLDEQVGHGHFEEIVEHHHRYLMFLWMGLLLSLVIERRLWLVPGPPRT